VRLRLTVKRNGGRLGMAADESATPEGLRPAATTSLWVASLGLTLPFPEKSEI